MVEAARRSKRIVQAGIQQVPLSPKAGWSFPDALRTILHTLSKGFLITGAVSIGVALGLVALSRSLEPER